MLTEEPAQAAGRCRVRRLPAACQATKPGPAPAGGFFFCHRQKKKQEKATPKPAPPSGVPVPPGSEAGSG